MPRPRGSSGCRQGHLLASWIVRLGPVIQARANRRAIYLGLVSDGTSFWLHGTGFRPLSQLRNADTQTIGKPHHVVPARVTPPMLDVTDPCLDEAGALGNLNLAQAALVPNGADGHPQGGCIGHGRRHG